ncbi:MAG: hypothetical protein OEY59_12620 [Deltaproteobacteria bacterium]|nr:hypothetical protein [Deltaproteobacteria bacterium]
MEAFLKTLSEDQLYWFAKLLIVTVNIDQNITLSEMDVLNKVLSKVTHPEKKTELLKLIESEDLPEIEPPKDIPVMGLAEIYTQVASLLISDASFSDREREYLKDLSKLFYFSDGYCEELAVWTEKGFEWKKKQAKLVDKPFSPDYFQVPYSTLNMKQRVWYGEIMISIILIDGFVHELEVSLVKLLISIVDDSQERKKLLAYVKNKYSPRLRPPPSIPRETLELIMLEGLQMAALDENISIKELNHIKEIAGMCDLNLKFIEEAVEWYNEGIQWVKGKRKLIQQARQTEKPKPDAE